MQVAVFWHGVAAYLYINRGRYVHAFVCPRPCVAAKPRAAKPPRVAAKPRGEAACPRCDPPCGRAQLVIIIIIIIMGARSA